MTRLHDPDSPDPPVGEFSTSELGALLRESRIALGRELEDVAAELRIRLVYLQAIEQGRLDDLPGIAYATGFLRAYADFLDLDGNDLVRRFKAAGMAMSQATDLHLPSPVEEGRLPTGSVLLVAALLAFGAYGGWYYMSSQGRDPIVNVAALPDRLAELVGIDSEKPQATDAEDAAPSDAAPVSDTVTDTVAAGPETTDTTPNAVASMTDGASDAAPPGAGQGGAPMASAEITTTAENAAPPPPQAAPAGAARIDQPPTSPVATAEASATTTDEAAATPAETTPAAPAPAVAQAVLPEPPAAPKRKPAAEARAAAPPTATPTALPTAPPTATTTATTTAPEVPVAPVASVDAPSATTIVAAATSGEPSGTDAAVPGAEAATTPTASHRVVLRANIDTWVEVAAAEETPVLSRLMREGETFVVPTQPGLMMATGNAGGIEILVDGKAIPRLGSIGEVRKNVALDAESLLNTATATR